MKEINSSCLVSSSKKLSPFDMLSGMVRETTGMANDVQDEDGPFLHAET